MRLSVWCKESAVFARYVCIACQHKRKYKPTAVLHLEGLHGLLELPLLMLHSYILASL